MTQGIYKLTNNINNQVYIGQSVDIEERFKEHMSALKSKKHHAYKLQRFYNQNYKRKSFKIEYTILEIVKSETYLNAREKHYIDLYDSYTNGFNSIGMNGRPTITAKRERQNKRIEKIRTEKEIHDGLISKYKDNLILTRNEYNAEYLYRVNEIIKYFVRNYNLDTYVAEINQYKHKVEMKVHHIHSSYCKIFIYNTKYKNITIDTEMQKYIYKGHIKSKIYDNKLSNAKKSKRKYIWFMKKLINLDEDIIKYNALKYVTDRISIPFKDVEKIIGYEGKYFRRHILEDDEIYEMSKELGITYPKGKVEIELN